MKAIINTVGLLITLSIWYYLLYQMLVRVQATELMWFLFWVYVPFGVLIKVLSDFATKAEK